MIQRQSRCNDHVDGVPDIVNAAGMDKTYGTNVVDEWFDIHDYDDETDHGTDNDTDDDTDGDTDTDDAEHPMVWGCRESAKLKLVCFYMLFNLIVLICYVLSLFDF